MLLPTGTCHFLAYLGHELWCKQGYLCSILDTVLGDGNFTNKWNEISLHVGHIKCFPSLWSLFTLLKWNSMAELRPNCAHQHKKYFFDNRMGYTSALIGSSALTVNLIYPYCLSQESFAVCVWGSSYPVDTHFPQTQTELKHFSVGSV